MRDACLRHSTRLALLVALSTASLTVACGAPVAPFAKAAHGAARELPSQLRLTRPGAPWPTSVAGCIIPRDAQTDPCGASIDIQRARLSSVPIARLARRVFAEVRWSQLPTLGDAPLAHVDVRAEGISLEGWASLSGQSFTVRRAVPIIQEHLWVPPGGSVSILGTSSGEVAIAVATPFAAPRRVETTLQCEAFGAIHETTRAVSGPPYAVPTGRRLSLRGEPGRSVVFAFDVDPTSRWVWLGARDGYVHIAGGQPPFQSALSDTPLLFDGWVAEDTVRRTDEDSSDRDSGCDILDIDDPCSRDVPLHDAPIYAGALPGGEPIGTVSSGTALILGQRQGEFVAFTTTNEVLIAPPGQRFWIRAADIGGECVTSTDDGCPPCPGE